MSKVIGCVYCECDMTGMHHAPDCPNHPDNLPTPDSPGESERDRLEPSSRELTADELLRLPAILSLGAGDETSLATKLMRAAAVEIEHLRASTGGDAPQGVTEAVPTGAREEEDRGPTGCFRDYTIRGSYRWFIRRHGEYRQGPYLEETARLVWQQEKTRAATTQERDMVETRLPDKCVIQRCGPLCRSTAGWR